MTTRERRLQRLEAHYLRTIVAPMAQEYGLSVDELVVEVTSFMALSDAEQDAELTAQIADAEARGDADEVRILREAWDAIRSYRGPSAHPHKRQGTS
jgi:hypothetical protein